MPQVQKPSTYIAARLRQDSDKFNARLRLAKSHAASTPRPKPVVDANGNRVPMPERLPHPDNPEYLVKRMGNLGLQDPPEPPQIQVMRRRSSTSSLNTLPPLPSISQGELTEAPTIPSQRAQAPGESTPLTLNLPPRIQDPFTNAPIEFMPPPSPRHLEAQRGGVVPGAYLKDRNHLPANSLVKPPTEFLDVKLKGGHRIIPGSGNIWSPTRKQTVGVPLPDGSHVNRRGMRHLLCADVHTRLAPKFVIKGGSKEFVSFVKDPSTKDHANPTYTIQDRRPGGPLQNQRIDADGFFLDPNPTSFESPRLHGGFS